MRLKRKSSLWIALALVAGALPLVLYAVLEVPEWIVNQYHLKSPNDRATQVAANRTALINLFGGLAVAVTIYFTAKTYQVTQERLVIEMTAKALEQLGSANISTRIGAIHILGRIARAHERDYFPIVRILTAYVRTRVDDPSAESPRTAAQRFNGPDDVRTALAIVGERYYPDPRDYSVDISNMILHHVWLPYADFSDVYCWNTDFHDVMLLGANLRRAEFNGARFDWCDFKDVDFTDADLSGVSMKRPENLKRSQLAKARNVPDAVLDAASED